MQACNFILSVTEKRSLYQIYILFKKNPLTQIPGAYVSTITTNPNLATITTNTRFCGRFFGTQGATSNTTMCSKTLNPFFLLLVCGRSNIFFSQFSATTTPFTVNVNFDADEVINTSSGTSTLVDEAADAPGGITGFRLCYKQDSTNCSQLCT